jgi:hypothetical protein
MPRNVGHARITACITKDMFQTNPMLMLLAAPVLGYDGADIS